MAYVAKARSNVSLFQRRVSPTPRELPHFIAWTKPPTPVRRILPFEVMPDPKYFKRKLGPRQWSNFDVAAMCFLTAAIVGVTLLCVLGR